MKKTAKTQPVKAKRGAFRPKKSDLEAYSDGTLTPHAKRLDAIIDRAFRFNDRRKNAVEKFEANMDSLFAKLVPDDQGISVISLDGKRRVTKSRHNVVKGNANAYRAKALIDEFVTEILHRKALSQDETNMASFLKNVIQESKGRILMTKPMVEFKRQAFTDPRLKEAQRLLNDAFDITESKVYYYCEVFDPETRKWLAA